MNQLVVVITGASDGIGKATALEFGRRGAKVVVAARRKDSLDEVVKEISEHGGESIAIQVDVTDEEAMRKLAETTIQSFGKIDVWVNNAAVIAFGEFESIPSHVFKRVIEVNFFGYVNGARAVIPYFKEQNRGLLINVSSVAGTIGQPYTTPYSASKFAIRGFSESLRWELEPYGIHVCAVLPASIDTPLFQHGANYMGKAPKPMKPIYHAQDVAEKIYGLVNSPKSEVYVGTMAPLLANAHKVAPDLTAKYYASQVRSEHFQDHPAPDFEGNLFAPMVEYSGVSGGWDNY